MSRHPITPRAQQLDQELWQKLVHSRPTEVPARAWLPITDLFNRILDRLERLESQSSFPQVAQTEPAIAESEKPSSPDTTPVVAVTDGSTISYSWSSLANRAGHLPRSVRQAIAASFSLQPILGNEQAEVILSIHTSKVSTPPAGSLSPSTAAPTREGNGHAGEHTWRLGTTMFEYCESCDERRPYPSSPSTDIHAQGEGRA